MKNDLFLKILAKHHKNPIHLINNLLSEHGINIDYINATLLGETNYILLQVSNTIQAIEILQHFGLHVLKENVIVIKLVNKTGMLALIAKLLKENDIILNSATIVEKDQDYGLFALVVDDYEKATQILADFIV